MKLSLNAQIILGALIGLVGGLILSQFPDSSALTTNTLYVSGILGNIFVNLLKMILIPLVFASITVGIANLRKHTQMNKVWPTTLIYFMSTTGLAVLLGLIVVNIFKPGVGLEVNILHDAMTNATTMNVTQLSLPAFFENFIGNLFKNPITAMASGQILPTVIFALFLGIALIRLGDAADVILKFMQQLFDITMLMVQWIMLIAPLGIAALLLKLVATQDISILLTLGKFIAVVIGATLFHGFVTLPVVLKVFSGRNPIEYLIHIKEALITALSTSSSSATLPITIRCVQQNAKVDKNISDFMLPLGTTINMDGTALYEAVAALFIANLVGIDLNIIQQLIVFLTSIIAAMGAPGIPSAGMVTMVMVLQSVGLPAEAIAILLPIDRILDSVRTMINVEGDCIGCAVVEKMVQKP